MLSRCLQFNLKQMPPAAIAAHLAKLLDAEGIRFEPEALAPIGRAASGSMRDALSLLRITSYNVCYTKLLRSCPPSHNSALPPTVYHEALPQ